MKSIECLSVLAFLLGATGEFYYETDTRVVIVAGKTPEDGHLRLHRSAIARNFDNVKLLVSDGNQTSSEMKGLGKYLESLHFSDTEIGVITSSSHYVMTNDPSTLAQNVAKVALTQDGNIVMAHPMDNNFNEIATPYDEHIKKLEEILNNYKGDLEETYHPSPRTMEEWRDSLFYYNKYKKMLVKKHQFQLSKNSLKYDDRFCGFAGLTKALLHFVKEVDSMNLENVRSLNDLCSLLSTNGASTYDLRVVTDWNGLVFKRTPSDIKDVVLVKDPKSRTFANHLETELYSYPPLMLVDLEVTPYLVFNFATAEVLLPPSNNPITFLDRPINDFNQYFNGTQNFPTVEIIAIVGADIKMETENFLQRISKLTYPSSKITLSLIFHHLGTKTSKYYEEIIGRIFDKKQKDYFSIKAVLVAASDIYSVFEKAWSLGRESKGDFVFLVDSSVRILESDTIEELIRSNRNVVSPILQSPTEQFNFKAERSGTHLKDNLLTDLFSSRYQDESESISMVGLLQVPFVFGSALFRVEIVRKTELHFNICEKGCPSETQNCDTKAKNENEEQICQSNYYENLEDPIQMAWGIISKNISERGFIIYLNNKKIYGKFLASKNLDRKVTNPSSENPHRLEMQETKIPDEEFSKDIRNALKYSE